jgi:hypothetical protein
MLFTSNAAADEPGCNGCAIAIVMPSSLTLGGFAAAAHAHLSMKPFSLVEYGATACCCT